MHQLFFGSLQIHRHHVALDELGDFGADHVGAEELPGLLVEDHLDQTLVLAERDGLAVADERKAADADVEFALFRRLLGQARRGDLRRAIGAAGNEPLVDRVRVQAFDGLDADDAFVLGLVRKQRRAGDVADRVNAGHVGLAEAVDRVISAVGVVGNIENLGLEKLGVKTERGAIVVDGLGKTNVPGIYAIGDVAGPPLLAHKAEHEGVMCVEAIKGLHPHPMDKNLIPGCTYCHPQVASVGLTEAAAKEKKLDVRVGRFPFVGNGKAIALGEDQGLVKVIFDKKTGALLGAHMVGAEVTELIQGYVVAMNLETTEEELMHTVFPHPTLSEMMGEAVLDAYGRALNI